MTISRIINTLIWALSVLAASGFILATLSSSHNNINNISTDEPSNMSLKIDHATGCQYLSNGIFGGLTPRLDKNGRQICEKE